MYKFKQIKVRVAAVRGKLATSRYKTTDPKEMALAELADELLEKVMASCDMEDITMVRLYWDQYILALRDLETLNS